MVSVQAGDRGLTTVVDLSASVPAHPGAGPSHTGCCLSLNLFGKQPCSDLDIFWIHISFLREISAQLDTLTVRDATGTRNSDVSILT